MKSGVAPAAPSFNMLIVTAHNVTGDGKFTHADGTADYDVWVGINRR